MGGHRDSNSVGRVVRGLGDRLEGLGLGKEAPKYRFGRGPASIKFQSKL